MRVLQGTVAAIAVCLALAGCQDDGKEPTAGQSATSTTTDEQPTEAPAATGPAVKGDIFTLHAPEGWTFNKDFSTDFLDQYSNPDTTRDERMYVGELAGEVRPLDEVAKANFEGFATTGTKRQRLSGATVAGEPAYHFTASGGYGKVVEEFGVIKDGQQVTFGITLTGSKAERQAVIDSVLASWEWK
jgi:hypothetical protein